MMELLLFLCLLISALLFGTLSVVDAGGCTDIVFEAGGCTDIVFATLHCNATANLQNPYSAK